MPPAVPPPPPAAPSPSPNGPSRPPAGPSPSPAGPSALANLRAALALWRALRRGGLRQVVICPGSRSAPLAVAAALLEPAGLALHTALDERSAAFFALGLARALGAPAAVLTTSGSAVAQLLPACVEADHGTIPLLLISADRPARLKGCGANQSVNQEHFLRSSCRAFLQGEVSGLGGMDPQAVEALAHSCLLHCLGRTGGPPPGAVHLNLPLEEPLHGDGATLAELAADLAAEGSAAPAGSPADRAAGGPAVPAAASTSAPAIPGAPRSGHDLDLDPDQPGVVVAGPWRGSPAQWGAHRQALLRWQRRSGWPVLADGLSGLRGDGELELVCGYDLLLEQPAAQWRVPQVLRLGSLPASRRLERWLAALDARQVLVSEGDPRPLDPLGRIGGQDPSGLAGWLARLEARRPDGHAGAPSPEALAKAGAWRRAEAALQALLERELPPGGRAEAAGGPAAWSEPALARTLARLLPAGLPLMLANSSPVRDWETFAAGPGPARPVLGFRGASGIDGTLSEACGLAQGYGACLLLSGDLALLHDSNGWLWRPQLKGRLTVVLIDNQGGGIFEQLPIRCGPEAGLDFERLFAMPQPLDPLALAALHGVPAREVVAPAALPAQLAWALELPFSLLVVRTDRRRDAALRQRLRTMASTILRP